MSHRKPTLLTGDHIREHFEDALTLLRHVRRTLSNALDRLESDDAPDLGEIARKQAELETALKRAFEAEERYNDWQAKAHGIRRAAEIDFAALREELTCRLNTLRDCCDGEG